MALIKCPDCEKMVSDKVEICPFCGCPAKFFTTSTDKSKNNISIENNINSDEMIYFDFCGIKLSYKSNSADFAYLFGMYLKLSDDSYLAMKTLYQDAGNITEVLKTLPDKAGQFINGIVNEGTKYLYSIGVNITPEEFINKYSSKYSMNYAPYYEEIVDEYSAILDKKQALQAYRSAENARRSRWQGGGFGLSGAIKGAVTASALNMGADFLHSFGDASKSSNDNSIIQSKFENLYKSKETENKLCCSVSICIMNVYYAIRDELINARIFKNPIVLDKRQADTLYDTTMRYETNNAEIFKNMVQCIFYYPGEQRFYTTIYDELLNGTNDFDSFLKFWNLEYFFEDFHKTKESIEKFNSFAKEIGLDNFDYSDFTALNAAILRKKIEEFKKSTGEELPLQGKTTKRIFDYFKKYSEINNNYKNSVIVSWMSKNLSMSDYLKIIKSDSKYFINSVIPNIWVLGDTDLAANDSEGNCPSTKTKKKLQENNAEILFYYDTTLLKTGGKGFAVTTNYFWDLKSSVKINVKDILKMTVVQIKKDSYGISITDGIKEIIIRDTWYKFNDTPDSLDYFVNVLKYVCVNYLYNIHFTLESIPNNNSNFMYCTGCGKQILRTTKFCNYCGAKVIYKG